VFISVHLWLPASEAQRLGMPAHRAVTAAAQPVRLRVRQLPHALIAGALAREH
jgi:hypothetical protein